MITFLLLGLAIFGFLTASIVAYVAWSIMGERNVSDKETVIWGFYLVAYASFLISGIVICVSPL